MKTPKLNLSQADQDAVNKAFATIKNVINKYDVNIANVIGLVSKDDLKQTDEQVRIKFAEETSNVMNMIAFD